MLTTIAFYTVLSTSPIALPGGPPVAMDYLVYDAANRRVWVPAGNTGNVDVIDVPSGKLTPIAGFPTAPSPRPGRPNMGPSSAAVGDGMVWVGNRGDKKLCAFDGKTLAKRGCVELTTMPDGLQYVASTHELWVTTPRDQTLTVVSVGGKTRAISGTIKLDGLPEGYALDAGRGVFYTNLEDKDKTLAIDIKTRKVLATWSPGCGKEGPRGLVIDGARRLLLVACTDGVVSLDVAHDGKEVGRLKTGAGVDNIDYYAPKKLLYVASGRDGMLTVIRVADGGALSEVATAPTAKGARNPVVDGSGAAYVADSLGGRLIVVQPPSP
jgi:DNA-binding beta-propeller fold protein YncE